MKNIIYGFIFLMLMNTSLSGYTTIEDKTTLKLLSPQLAERETGKIQLSNGLQAYIISDPNTDQSGAVLSVQTGSWQDPDELPGLAHFLEHMLFLGTEKYPVESEFSQFISQQGGMTNAFTTNDTTSFLFSVANKALPEALDRFSSFFISPLFNQSGTLRELHAVNQEFSHNAQNDGVRLLQVLQELGNKAHPYSRFTMGNAATLQATTREELISWYETHYSPELMRLVVLSNLPLEDLKKLVEKDFQNIPQRKVIEKNIDVPLASEEHKGTIAYIEPLQEIQTLVIVWEIPNFSSMKNDGVDMLTSLILGDEGEKSLATHLKQEGLAEALFCGLDKVGKNKYQLFLSIDLTEEGVQQSDRVIKEIFEAINFYKNNSVPQYLFDELEQLAKLKYQYQSKQQIFQEMEHHGELIAYEEIATYPEKKAIPQKFNPQGIKNVFSLLTPSNATIAIMAQPSMTGRSPNKKEKWLGVPYALAPIAEEKMSEWAHSLPNWDVGFPASNPFIPKNLKLVPSEKINGAIPEPKLLIDTNYGRFYCASDSHFHLPEIAMHFQIKTDQVDVGVATKTALADLYIIILEEILNTTDYLASIAGLDSDIQREDFGIMITLNGYNDKAPLLLKKILEAITTYNFSEETFKIQKNVLLRDYQNESLQSPLEQAQEFLKDALYKERATTQAKINALKKISFNAFKEYTQTIFKKAYVEAMLFGNITEIEAVEISNNFLKTLNSEAYPKAEHPKAHIVSFNPGEGPFYMEFPVKTEGNGIILATLQGDASFEKRAIQKIISEAISEPFFTELRTIQQTGYIVYNTAEEIERNLFTLFAAQSSRYAPQDLLYRFEKFLEEYFQKAPEVRFSEHDFDLSKANFLIQLRNPAKNTKSMGKLLNRLAFVHDGEFHYFDKLAEAFKELAYETFSTTAQEFLGRSNSKRLAILTRGTDLEKNGLNYELINSMSELHKLLQYGTSAIKDK